MGVNDLRARHGGRYDEAVRRAIRAEIDGGDDCLTALHHAHRLAKRLRLRMHHQLAQRALDALRELAGRMEEEIRRRYNIPDPRPPIPDPRPPKQEQAMYALVSRTDYYGPETRTALLQVSENLEGLRAIQDASPGPDYDPQVGCHRLSHNQSSPATYEIRKVVAITDGDPYLNWDYLPPSAHEAALRICEIEDIHAEEDLLEVPNRAMQETGMECLVGPGGEFVIVEIEPLA